jgi:hypothetical protein
MGQAASGLITSATAVICHAWTNRLWFKNFMKHLGFVWKCTTRGMNPIKVRLLADELVVLGLAASISTETVRQALKKTTSSRGSSSRGASRRTPMPTTSGAWKT